MRAADERPRNERRAGSYSRRRAQERLDSFVRANWQRPVVALAASLAVTTGIVLLPVGPAPLRWGLSGLFLGMFCTYLWHWLVIASGSTGAQLGDTAEQWTSTELRRLRRHGWRVVDHVIIRPPADIDHVAIGPDGVLAVETKWRSDDLDIDQPDWLTAAAERLHRQTRDLKGYLRLHHRDVPVTSLIVVWGPFIRQRDDDTVVMDNGVRVIAGRHLRVNIEALGNQHLSPAEVGELHAKLVTDLAKRDAEEADRLGPQRTTVGQHAQRAFDRFCGFTVGFSSSFFAFFLGGWWTIATVVGAVVLGIAGRRVRTLRHGATGWIAGAVAAVPLVALLVLLK